MIAVAEKLTSKKWKRITIFSIAWLVLLSLALTPIPRKFLTTDQMAWALGLYGFSVFLGLYWLADKFFVQIVKTPKILIGTIILFVIITYPLSIILISQIIAPL